MESIGDDTLCILLTGGRSRRMGRDKASIARVSGLSQARHLGVLVTELEGVRGVELGPGVSGLAAHGDRGEGPAVALADAMARGHLGARVLVVVPVDLFRLERGGLGWLVRQARQAPLVVRTPAGAAWTVCGGRVEAFRWGQSPRSMRALVRGFRLVAPPASIVDQFVDADRPEDLP